MARASFFFFYPYYTMLPILSIVVSSIAVLSAVRSVCFSLLSVGSLARASASRGAYVLSHVLVALIRNKRTFNRLSETQRILSFIQHVTEGKLKKKLKQIPIIREGGARIHDLIFFLLCIFGSLKACLSGAPF